MLETIFQQSINLTIWLQGLGDWLDPVMQFFTLLGNEEFYLFVMPVFIWVLDYQLGFKLGVMLLLTTGINDLAKLTFRMPRPYWVDPAAARFSSPAGGYGLPSGHSQTPISIFGLLAAEFNKRWLTIAVIFVVFMIGLSRIYLGEHFYIDVLAGWTIGGIVLFAFIKLAPAVSQWFHQKSFGVKVGAVFAYSIGIILIAAIVVAIPHDYQLPQEWLDNARQAYPDEPIEPLKLSNVITSAATLFGLALGYFWLDEQGGFNANSGQWWQRALRFLIGLVGVALFWMGLGEVFPDGENLVSWALRFFRYGLVGVWIAGIAPLIFIKLGLGTAEEQA
ncbi:MAG: phosphatase PAP2 family protein [Anaerolineales bacterium]|nr:phosphatase PAP2 family protein [Anaerolineales bacterium]